MRTVILSVTHPLDLQNKVAAIKGVRGLSGLGLKEAKDLVESVMPHHSEVININHDILEPRYTEYVTMLKSSGLGVQVTQASNVARKGMAEEIRRLVTYATMSAQYDIGKALLDVLETYCPEPADEYLDKEENNDAEFKEQG